MVLSCNYYALKGQRLEKILAQTAALKVPEWPSYGNSRKVTQNPHFLRKVQRGNQCKFFKNRQKSSPRFTGLRALLRKWHYPLISIHLKCKNWRRFKRKQRLQKCRMAKLWQFSQGHTKPSFSENVQSGDQGKFFKNRLKSSLRLKGSKALWPK